MIAIAAGWLWGKIAPYALYILMGLAVVVTVLLVLAKVKQAGVLQERVETMQRTIEAVKERKEIERANAQERRDTGVTANDQLRRKWQRD
jgi:predicted Holliday junction resolvase-like endonuclease